MAGSYLYIFSRYQGRSEILCRMYPTEQNVTIRASLGRDNWDPGYRNPPLSAGDDDGSVGDEDDKTDRRTWSTNPAEHDPVNSKTRWKVFP